MFEIPNKTRQASVTRRDLQEIPEILALILWIARIFDTADGFGGSTQTFRSRRCSGTPTPKKRNTDQREEKSPKKDKTNVWPSKFSDPSEASQNKGPILQSSPDRFSEHANNNGPNVERDTGWVRATTTTTTTTTTIRRTKRPRNGTMETAHDATTAQQVVTARQPTVAADDTPESHSSRSFFYHFVSFSCPPTWTVLRQLATGSRVFSVSRFMSNPQSMASTF